MAVFAALRPVLSPVFMLFITFHRLLFVVLWQLFATIVAATCVMLAVFRVDFPAADLLQLRQLSQRRGHMFSLHQFRDPAGHLGILGALLHNP